MDMGVSFLLAARLLAHFRAAGKHAGGRQLLRQTRDNLGRDRLRAIFCGSVGSRPAQTRVSKPSAASAPASVSRCSILKLERPQATTALSIPTSSPNRVGSRNCARVSTTGWPMKSIVLEILDLLHPGRALDQHGGRGVENREIARIVDDAGGVAVAPFDTDGTGVGQHCGDQRGAIRSAPSSRTTSPLR